MNLLCWKIILRHSGEDGSGPENGDQGRPGRRSGRRLARLKQVDVAGDGGGRDAQHPAKSSAQMRRVGEPGTVCDLRQRAAGPKHIERVVKTTPKQIPVDRYPDLFVE